MAATPEHDPFAPIEASPRFATPLAVLGLVLGLAAAFTGLAAILGPLGMAFGLVAHVKGSRLGMPAAVVAAIGMIVGMTVILYLR
ncbi:MAG: hypothetical protein ACLFUG_12885 [Nitriliruptoraceae bacterium]